jgi:hypothetical protein
LLNGNQTAPRYIVGSVNLAEFFVTVAIALTFALTLGFQSFLWHISLPLIIGGVLVAPVAAYASSRVPPALMGVAVGLLLVVLNVKTVSQSLFKALGLTLPAYLDALIITLVGLIAALLVIGLLFLSRRLSGAGHAAAERVVATGVHLSGGGVGAHRGNEELKKAR